MSVLFAPSPRNNRTRKCRNFMVRVGEGQYACAEVVAVELEVTGFATTCPWVATAVGRNTPPRYPEQRTFVVDVRNTAPKYDGE